MNEVIGSHVYKSLRKRVEELEGEASSHKRHAQMVADKFSERMGDRKRPTWYAVNALQEHVDFHRLFASQALQPNGGAE